MSKPTSRLVGKSQYLTLLATFLATSMIAGILIAGLAVPTAGAMGMAAKAGPKIFESLPAEFDLPEPSEQSVLLDRNGTEIARFWASNRIIVSLDQISKNLQNAIVAIEDRRFYEHKGIDPEGIARAAVNNLTHHSTQGASTLTQQYVKNMLLEDGIQQGNQELIDSASEQTISRKLREARYAIALEQKMSKDDILSGYLNIAPFGPNVYGAQAASLHYFSKNAADLTVAEAALMAGIVKSPNDFDPMTNPQDSQARRDVVLATMLAQKKITQEEYDEAINTNVEDMLKPDNSSQGCAGAGSAAYFCDYVLQSLYQSDALGANRGERQQALMRGGLTIKTTFDWGLQNKAMASFAEHVPVADPSGVNAVLVTRDPNTGAILAMAQNTNYGIPTEGDPTATQNSYAADTAHGGGAGFQAGSTLKPFTLLQWYAEGHSAWERTGGHSKTFTFEDWNTCDPDNAHATWTVGDLPGKGGTYTTIGATEYSVNRAFAEMASKVQLCEIFATMKKLGIHNEDGSQITAIPANIISASATPLAMAGAFSAFTTAGQYCEPMAITEILDRSGNQIGTFEPSCSQAVDATAARKVARTLDIVTSSSSYYTSRIGRPIVGKTGTTDNNDNVWFVGGTSQLVTAAWVGHGNASSQSLNNLTIGGVYFDTVYGTDLAAPLWRDYMGPALDGYDVVPIDGTSLGSPPQPKPTKTAEPTQKNDTQKSEDNAGKGGSNG